MLEGSTYNLGDFSIEITNGPGTNHHPVLKHPSKSHYDKTIYCAIPVPPEQMWQAKGQFMKNAVDNRGNRSRDLGTRAEFTSSMGSRKCSTTSSRILP